MDRLTLAEREQLRLDIQGRTASKNGFVDWFGRWYWFDYLSGLIEGAASVEVVISEIKRDLRLLRLARGEAS